MPLQSQRMPNVIVIVAAVLGGVLGTITTTVYPSATNTAAFTTPAFHPSNNAASAWPVDASKPGSPSPTSVPPDRPRLIAPASKWAALPQLIQNDPCLQSWNNTIFVNAKTYFSMDPVKYFKDDSSCILDNARDVKRRIKAFAYAYRMPNDTNAERYRKWNSAVWARCQ